MVTGKVSETNLKFAGGKLVLSLDGAKVLLEELYQENLR
jgi:AbrB C-terminal domain